MQGQASYKVRFFATKDVANVGASAVTLFNERLELCDRPHFGMDFGKVKKGTLFKKYQVACREAKDALNTAREDDASSDDDVDDVSNESRQNMHRMLRQKLSGYAVFQRERRRSNNNNKQTNKDQKRHEIQPTTTHMHQTHPSHHTQTPNTHTQYLTNT